MKTYQSSYEKRLQKFRATTKAEFEAEDIAKEQFLTYVRTHQFMRQRFKAIDIKEGIHIPQTEIESRFFPFPKMNRNRILMDLIISSRLKMKEAVSANGNKPWLYSALQPGAIDLSMITRAHKEYSPLELQMMQNLMHVTLESHVPSSPYFDAFMKHRNEYLKLFFTIDSFSGRVHTPVSNFHSEDRQYLLIDGCLTVSFDVVTMQPLLLGKILNDQIGLNLFSQWMDQGQDIYLMLQQITFLETREQSKKRFFEMLFSLPGREFIRLFRDSDWIKWINRYKRVYEPGNPHSKLKPHSNLAWLLQTTEVQLMRKIWQALYDAGIIFLTVHDEIICKQEDSQQAEFLFRQIMDQEFKYYKLKSKRAYCTNCTPVHLSPLSCKLFN
jgi:hypothetical protein